MQNAYTLDELAKFLRRPAKDLKKKAENGELTGRKTGGEWVFSLPDVSLWIEREIASQSPNDAKHFEESVSPYVEPDDNAPVSELLAPERIELRCNSKTKSSIIARVAELSESSGLLWDAAEMKEALRQREEMSSTALECGVAILHPRRPRPDIIGGNFLTLAVTGGGVPFGGGFGNLTDVFFLLCCQTDASYLRTLGRLSRIIRTEGFLDELRECFDPLDVVELFRRAESELE